MPLTLEEDTPKALLEETLPFTMTDSQAKPNLVVLENFRLPGPLKDHFQYVGSSGKNTVLKCLHCNSELRGQGKQIFNFQRHLADKHSVTVSAKPPVQANTLLDHLPLIPKKKPNPPTANAASQKMFRQAILDMIAVDGHPFSIMEGVGFQNFVQKLVPGVSCYSRRVIKRHLNEDFSKLVLPNLTQHLKDLPANSVHLALDMWTSRQQASIMGVNVNYISPTWKIHRRCLAFSPFPESHTGVNIEAKLRSVLEMRNLKLSQIGKVMADNAYNIVAAFNLSSLMTGTWEQRNLTTEEEDCDGDSDDDTDECDISDGDEEELIQIVHRWERLGCCAHSLQLCVKKALTQDSAAKHVLDLVNKITLHFRRSNKLSTRLKSKTKFNRGLILPGKTRWNSMLHSLSRLLKDDVFSAVSDILKENPLSSKSVSQGFSGLTDGVRPQLEEIFELLDPINTATNRLQADNITSSLVIPTILETYVNIKNVNTAFFPTLQRSLLDQLQRRFAAQMKESTYVAASILDPRQKTRVFKSSVKISCLNIPTEEAALISFNLLFDATDSDVTMISMVPAVHEMTVEEPQTKRRKKMVFDFLDTVSPSPNAVKSELEVYLQEAISKKEVDPLVFWKENESRFPRLASLARIYLSVPASSGDIERLFSIAGSLQRARRSSLQPQTLEQIMLYRDFRLPLFV